MRSLCGCGFYTWAVAVMSIWRPAAPSTSGGSSVCESDSSHVSDFTTENISTGSEAEVQLLLDRLKAPQRSELTRKRVIRKNLSSSHHI